jgi:hypothetical protein
VIILNNLQPSFLLQFEPRYDEDISSQRQRSEHTSQKRLPLEQLALSRKPWQLPLLQQFELQYDVPP